MNLKALWNKALASNRGMAGPAGTVITVVIAVVVIVAVAIPVTNSVITSANLTGISATIVGYIPTFLALAGLVVVTALFA